MSEWSKGDGKNPRKEEIFTKWDFVGKCLTNSSGWTWAHAPTGSFCFGHGMHGRWALALKGKIL